jgi:uncharacterized protein involved in cysteine biosynthesis
MGCHDQSLWQGRRCRWEGATVVSLLIVHGGGMWSALSLSGRGHIDFLSILKTVIHYLAKCSLLLVISYYISSLGVLASVAITIMSGQGLKQIEQDLAEIFQ